MKRNKLRKKSKILKKKKVFLCHKGQKEAIEKTLSTEDKIIAWQGVAGAGKTTAMELVASAMKEKGI